MKSLNQYINEASSPLKEKMSLEDSVSGKESGYDYVDLGLESGTMWATCNVGADKVTDPGLLFQFGRVDGYKYGDKNNKFRLNDQNLEDTWDEYIPQTTSGKVYDKGDILALKDDAANVNMGGYWRMPTNDQIKELLDNTKHSVETINDVKGMLFTSKKNGKQLFIPFAGYWYDGTFNALGSYADMWSSQVHSSNVHYAYRLYGNSRDDANVNSYYYRTCAFSVRGVFN